MCVLNAEQSKVPELLVLSHAGKCPIQVPLSRYSDLFCYLIFIVL